MLITLCYSVLTWLQSRHRKEITCWIQDVYFKEKASIILVRDGILYVSERNFDSRAESYLDEKSFSEADKSESFYSFGESTTRSASQSSSAYSTPRKDPLFSASDLTVSTESFDTVVQSNGPLSSERTISPFSPTRSSSGSRKRNRISDLCYNSTAIKVNRLLWEEDETHAIAVKPRQIVDLHDWTAFLGTKVEPSFDIVKADPTSLANVSIYILLEAEPGLTRKEAYRKFSQFGHLIAWKCGDDLGLILLSVVKQVIDLMHIFRIGQIVLEGGWRVYRLTTVTCEGTLGTLISAAEVPCDKTSLTPADLRRFTAGVFESRESSRSNTPCRTSTIPRDSSKHDITTINEETNLEEELENEILETKLPNWYERSPKKKRSIPTIPITDRPVLPMRKRLGSFCTSSLSTKSNSLASLLLTSKSASIDEEDIATYAATKLRALSSIGSCDSIVKTSSISLSNSRVQSPTATQNLLPMSPPKTVQSESSTPRKARSPGKKTLSRLGKPPNILVLSHSEKQGREIAKVLKEMLANDRYAVYEIRWDQLAVGGWADQAALLVVTGKIPDQSHSAFILQYLGDGGHLLAWCCQDDPFGPSCDNSKSLNDPHVGKVVHYGNNLSTCPIKIAETTWKSSSDGNSRALPPGVSRILETNDSEGYSRPLTVSTFARIKGTNEPVVLVMDGGALGGKAVLSQIHFEHGSSNEESSLALLSTLLSQHLGIDCTKIKAPEYSSGYLLGDFLKIKSFLEKTPATVQQQDLTVEFVPRGEKASRSSDSKISIKTLECPPKFSTVKYYENLSTKELGRLVVFTEVITSTMNVLRGHPLHHGLAVIACRQTSGKGRGKNVWLSPEGCACMSLQLNIDMSSDMGRRLSLFQHLVALSVVLAVKEREELNLRVKWPNDIYLDGHKIGGVLLETTIVGKQAIVNVGLGINVSNLYPTVSLNSALLASKKSYSIEQILALSLNELEGLLESIESGQIDRVLLQYTENWVHGSMNDAEDSRIVDVEISEGTFTECNICGIDEFGFLRVKELTGGNIFSVQPDGNSFDITNKLIAIKQ